MTKDELITKLKKIMNKWHEGGWQGNDGNQGNTLERLLGIQENNISLPDLGGIYELKTQKKESEALITLFHSEPTNPPRSVPNLLLSLGWPHQQAGTKYSSNEMSFRSTTSQNFSDRGFKIDIFNNKLHLIFDPNQVSVNKPDVTKCYRTYGDWLNDVEKRRNNYKDVFPVYYDLSDLLNKITTKLDNTVLVLCKTKSENNVKYFFYDEVFIFKGIKYENFYNFLINGGLYLDFDARTGHNHGTKFRVKKDKLPLLFQFSEKLD
jgi:hypothetical protein